MTALRWGSVSRRVCRRFAGAASISDSVRIADEGEGFDFDTVPDPLQPENLMRTSGRGLFLIRSFMDEFRMAHLDNGGTEVTLIKYTVSK